MCELFGASSSGSRGYSRWLSALRLHGGLAADNPDGWGIAAWRGPHARIEKAPEPAWNSARFQGLADEVHAPLVIAHVRKARLPPVPGLTNTHPFAHECCGREWVFAHNGLVPLATDCPSACVPAGETDSEAAFCRILAAIAGNYDAGDPAPWVRRLADLATTIAHSGKFNFLLSDGRLLVAYGHDRLHFHESRPAEERLALVATEPLTDDDWHPFAPGELRVYRDGAPVVRLPGEGIAAPPPAPALFHATSQGDAK